MFFQSNYAGKYFIDYNETIVTQEWMLSGAHEKVPHTFFMGSWCCLELTFFINTIFLTYCNETCAFDSVILWLLIGNTFIHIWAMDLSTVTAMLWFMHKILKPSPYCINMHDDRFPRHVLIILVAAFIYCVWFLNYYVVHHWSTFSFVGFE